MPFATVDGTRIFYRLEGNAARCAQVDTVMQCFFSPETLAQGNPYASSIRAVILGTDPAGYAGCCSAIRDMDHTGSLAHRD
jgi:hypothetical protein